jgi:ATP-dependent 26S proteasome regulatory subunit
MIVGPPGSSKTLAVTVVAENAKGEYSKSAFYKVAPKLIPSHYQCSRRSTSRQIQEVFEGAIERQAKVRQTP